ncbi:MAG: 50S ribosomal protein L6 [Bdellovibrionales bacterium]|nr:50S ribosomal protein L6 [Bdellovibrionales bacterium]
MSRVGKAPVYFKDKVKVSVNGSIVKVENGKFAKVIELKPIVRASVEDGKVVLTRENDEPQTRAFHGLFRALIQNAVTGMDQGWSKTLILNGVGYRANVAGKKLELNLGYSHPISYDIPDGIEMKVEKQTTLQITGYDRELVGQVAAKIRSFRPPEPFLGKGIRYEDEHIRRKAGKSAGK